MDRGKFDGVEWEKDKVNFFQFFQKLSVQDKSHIKETKSYECGLFSQGC